MSEGYVSTLIKYSILMFTFPIMSFFLSKWYVFDSWYPEGSTNAIYSAFVAVFAVHIVLAMFVRKAWREETESPQVALKQD